MDSIKYSSKNAQAVKVIVDSATNAEFFRSSTGKGYAKVGFEGHHEVHPLDGEGFRSWLSYQYYKLTGTLASKRDLEEAILLFEAKARYEGKEQIVYHRVAETPGRIYLDLGDRTGDAIEIDANTWSIVSQPESVRFVQPPGSLALSRPVRNPAALSRFQKLFRLSDEQLRLIVVWLLQVFYSIGHPILLLVGQGAFLLAEELRSIVDPHSTPVRANPKEQAEFLIGAGHGWIHALHLQKMTVRVAEGLSILNTGAGYGRRKGYTDSEEVILGGRRPVIVAAENDFIINPEIHRSMLTVRLAPIHGDERRAEPELRAECAQLRTGLLAYLLDGLVWVRSLSDYRPRRLPSHAQFALLGVRAEAAFEWPEGAFGSAYIAGCLAASPALTTLLRFGFGKRYWTGTATELLEELDCWATEVQRGQSGWPKDAADLGKKVKHAAPMLQDFGLSVESYRGSGQDRQRLIVLKLVQGWGG